MQRSIPDGPSGLTPNWLTTALREAGVIHHAAVTRVESEVIGEDRGFTGVVARLRLQYDQVEPEARPFLIAKFPLAVRTTRNLVLDLQNHYETILRALSCPPATVVHADLHLDNVIFVSSGEAPTVKIIDWQGVAWGVGAIDLSLFIVGALEVTERRVAEPDLLRRYQQILSTYGATAYTYDQLLHDYRLALLWQLAGTVGWLSRTDVAILEGRERELVEAIFTKGQLFTALRDHLEAIPVFG